MITERQQYCTAAKKKKKKFHKPLAYAKISSPVEVPPAVNITHFKKRGSMVRSEMCTWAQTVAYRCVYLLLAHGNWWCKYSVEVDLCKSKFTASALSQLGGSQLTPLIAPPHEHAQLTWCQPHPKLNNNNNDAENSLSRVFPSLDNLPWISHLGPCDEAKYSRYPAGRILDSPVQFQGKDFSPTSAYEIQISGIRKQNIWAVLLLISPL